MTPIPTNTPTVTPTPTITPTFTLAPTPTLTSTPTPQAGNQQPKNVVVKILDGQTEYRYGASAALTLYAGQNYAVEITATDDYNDGNKVVIAWADDSNIITKKYSLSDDGKVVWSGQLNIVQPGEYAITIWASDGNLASESIILAIEAVIAPTPTPTVTPTCTPTVTPTPTPWPILITDNLYSQNDISGQTDCDDLKGRELCVSWRVFPQTNIRQIHMYVSKNGEAPVYLGQPEKINDNYLVWQRGNFSHISRALRNGPEGGNNYQFFVYFIYPRSREGPYTHSSPVSFSLAALPPVAENKLIITDNPDSWENCASSGLIRLGDDLIPEPDIAERWAVSNGGLTYTFYLKQNVIFHDGRKVTTSTVYPWKHLTMVNT